MGTTHHSVRGMIFLVASALLTSAGTMEALARCSTIADGLQVLDSSVTLKVIRESPINCGPEPAPWECMANEGQLIIRDGYPGGWAIGVDAAGNHYNISARAPGDFDTSHRGVLLQRLDPNGVAVDLVKMLTAIGNPDGSVDAFQYSSQIQFDVTNGKILIAAYSASSCPDATFGLVEISGLPTLFDILLTFVPSGQTISAVLPAHPDGFRSADSMQVWAGDLRTLPDWSQAQPLACSATTNPTPGQVVTVADMLLDPAPGQGRYYITASLHGTDRRLGRQYVNGSFSARNPATLPVCGP